MIAFAALLEHLMFASSPATRIALLRHYFASRPDPERGLALAVLTGASRIPTVRPAVIRALADQRIDPALFQWSLEFSADLMETIALIWPVRQTNSATPELSELLRTPRLVMPDLVAGWLDASDARVRLALLTLITGRGRPIVAASMARAALAALGGVPREDIEQVWHGQAPPYTDLFRWLEARGPRPTAGPFRPFMLAAALTDPAALAAGPWQTEPLWDGPRVQLINGPAGVRLFSREADDVTATYRSQIGEVAGDVVLDIVLAGGSRPRLVDMLAERGEDLRSLPFVARRARLQAWFQASRPVAMALSEVTPVADPRTLKPRRDSTAGIAGLMLKHADSPYVAGRAGGHWWRWVPPPLLIDTVLLYAERGSYTVGVWRGSALVPVAKLAAPAEAAALDAWVRVHTTGRFGPVREVEKSLLLTIAYDAADASPRHKAGVVLRHARLVRIDPAADPTQAGRLEMLLGAS